MDKWIEKCIVKGCLNHPSEGKFVGHLCGPCYTMLTQGRKMPSEAWFAKPWVGLTDEEWQEIADKTDIIIWSKLKQAIEAKFREKNGG